MNFITRNAFAAGADFLRTLPVNATQIGIRPEHFHLTTNALDHAAHLQLSVTHAEYMGATQLIQGQILNASNAERIEVVLPTNQLVSLGQSVTLGFSPSDIHCFDSAGYRCENKNL